MSCIVKPYIFIDTCSLLESCWNRVANAEGQERFKYSQDKADRFWGKEFCALEAMGTVIIPARNYEELVKHSANKSKADLSSRAIEILQRVNLLRQSGRIEIIGDPNDPFADAVLLSVALKFRTQKNMAFITQDRKLAEDLEAIRQFQSVRPRKKLDIKIRRIDKRGSLEEHRSLGKSNRNSKEKQRGNSCASFSAQMTRNWWDARNE